MATQLILVVLDKTSRTIIQTPVSFANSILQLFDHIIIPPVASESSPIHIPAVLAPWAFHVFSVRAGV